MTGEWLQEAGSDDKPIVDHSISANVFFINGVKSPHFDLSATATFLR